MQSEYIYDEVFDAQEHYRLILDSMARPGKINMIPDLDIESPESINNAGALVAFALLNTDVAFYAEDDATVDFIRLHTSATVTELQKADFIFINGLQDSEFIASLKTGTLPYPEDSATIIADVAEISHSMINNAIQLILKGPGIQTTETIYITGLNPAILYEIKEQNTEFPLGLDMILTDRKNRMICIPRSNDFTCSPAGEYINNL